MMSKSDARKQREKMVREGKRNPSENRGIYALADLGSKKTKKKVEKMNQVKHKKQLFDQGEDRSDSCYFLCPIFDGNTY